MSLDKKSLTEQLKACLEQREQAIQLFHRLTGAVQVLEGQIKSLEEEDVDHKDGMNGLS